MQLFSFWAPVKIRPSCRDLKVKLLPFLFLPPISLRLALPCDFAHNNQA